MQLLYMEQKLKIKTVFTINAILSYVFGICFFFIPIFSGQVFGVVFDNSSAIALRILGAAFFGIGTVRWLFRDEPESPLRRKIITASVVQDSSAFLVILYAQLTGIFNAAGWFLVLAYWYFCLIYWYYLIKKPGDPRLD